MKVFFRVSIKILSLAIILLVFNEFLIYYLTLIQCKWPNLSQVESIDAAKSGDSGNNGNRHDDIDKPVKAMILADIHLLGPFRGHWADKLRREWQMHRTFQTSIQLFKPEVIFILGDLFDEGEWVDENQFQIYLDRYQKLFHTPDDIDVYGALGNHDVGFHYKMQPKLIKRFHRVYKNKPNSLISIKGVHFVLINSMAMEKDQCQLCKSTEYEIFQIGHRLNCAKYGNINETCTKLKNLIPSYSKPILLQHYPTYRDSDKLCIEYDATIINSFREGWEVLSKNSTDWLAQVLDNPRVVFSGHSHDFCHSKTQWNADEYTISSFSWRNKNNPKFLLAEFTTDDYDINVCHMPLESTVLNIYIYCFIFGIFAIGIIEILYFKLENKSKMHIYKNL